MSLIEPKDVLAVIEKAKAVNDVNALSLDQPLSDQGMDSLDYSGVLFNVEELFNVTIPDEVIDSLQSVNDIVNYVNSNR